MASTIGLEAMPTPNLNLAVKPGRYLRGSTSGIGTGASTQSAERYSAEPTHNFRKLPGSMTFFRQYKTHVYGPEGTWGKKTFTKYTPVRQISGAAGYLNQRPDSFMKLDHKKVAMKIGREVRNQFLPRGGSVPRVMASEAGDYGGPYPGQYDFKARNRRDPRQLSDLPSSGSVVGDMTRRRAQAIPGTDTYTQTVATPTDLDVGDTYTQTDAPPSGVDVGTLTEPLNGTTTEAGTMTNSSGTDEAGTMTDPFSDEYIDRLQKQIRQLEIALKYLRDKAENKSVFTQTTEPFDLDVFMARDVVQDVLGKIQKLKEDIARATEYSNREIPANLSKEERLRLKRLKGQATTLSNKLEDYKGILQHILVEQFGLTPKKAVDVLKDVLSPRAPPPSPQAPKRTFFDPGAAGESEKKPKMEESYPRFIEQAYLNEARAQSAITELGVSYLENLATSRGSQFHKKMMARFYEVLNQLAETGRYVQVRNALRMIYTIYNDMGELSITRQARILQYLNEL